MHLISINASLAVRDKKGVEETVSDNYAGVITKVSSFIKKDTEYVTKPFYNNIINNKAIAYYHKMPILAFSFYNRVPKLGELYSLFCKYNA